MNPNLRRTSAIVRHHAGGVRLAGVHDLIWGNVTGISGDVDDCNLSDDDRKRGISIEELITKENQ